MMRIGGLRLNLVLGKEIKGESLKDKGGEKGDFLKMGVGDRKDQREREKKREVLEGKLKEKRKRGGLRLEILDFLKKRR